MPDSEIHQTATDAPEVHPDLPKSRLVTLPLHNTWLVPVFRFLDRHHKVKPVPGVEVTDRSEGAAHVRIYTPDERHSDAALLWIHGGGLIIGSPEQNNKLCSEIARELGIVVISAYYRLAPKHPYPAAIDDCVAAWHWVRDAADQLGVDPARIAVGGESAGAGLAACLTQRIADEGGVQPRAQLLVYPMLDDRTAARRDLDEGFLVWTNRANRYGWSSYLGHECGAPDVPPYSVAARREHLEGLPPAWIGVGTIDLFLAECREYAERLERAGTRCTLYEVPGAPHGFLALAPEAQLSRDFVSAQIAFLGQHLGHSGC